MKRPALDPRTFWRAVAEQMIVKVLEEEGFEAADDLLDSALQVIQSGHWVIGEDPDDDTPAERGAAAVVDEFEHLALNSEALAPVDRYELERFKERNDVWAKHHGAVPLVDECPGCTAPVKVTHFAETGTIVADHEAPMCRKYDFAMRSLGSTDQPELQPGTKPAPGPN